MDWALGGSQADRARWVTAECVAGISNGVGAVLAPLDPIDLPPGL